jgi:hypothetical protein
VTSDTNALVDALRPLLRKVRTTDSAIKVVRPNGKKQALWTSEPLTPELMLKHLNDGPARGVCPMQYGSTDTMVGLFDIDDHDKSLPWSRMVDLGLKLMKIMRSCGLAPIPFRSSSGHGIHIYAVWANPQDAYSVRALMKHVLLQMGFTSGTGGVQACQIEIFPKTDRMREKQERINKKTAKKTVSRGSQFFLPLADKSVPLDPQTLADLPMVASSISWPESKPAQVLEKPQRVRHEGEASVELATLRSALAAIPNGAPELDDYHEWLKFMMAIHYESGGSEEGLELAHEFSQRGSNYDADVLDSKWDTFDDDCDRPVTGGTIIRAARDYGWDEVTAEEAFRLEPVEPDGEHGGYFDPGPDEKKSGGEGQAECQPDADETPLEPFRGPMADAVAAGLASSVKPQPELTMLSALIGMAACCGGHYHLPSGGRLNLYGVGVADTGWGKDRPREFGTEIARAGGAGLIGKPASGQGLEDALKPYRGILCEVDEVAHLVEALNGSKKPPYLIELSSMFLRLFSASAGIFNPRVKAASGDDTPRPHVPHPCVNLLGFATPEKLGEAVDVMNIAEGLIGRLLVVFGRPGVAPRRSKKLALPASVTDRGQEIQRAILVGRFDDDGIEIGVEPDADARLDEQMGEFDNKMTTTSSPFAKALLARSFEKCERIAGVLAVWDNPVKPHITLEHVTWAERFVRASDIAVLRFCGEYLHGGQVQADAALVLKVVKRILNKEISPSRKGEQIYVTRGLVPHSMALRASKLDKRRFDEAIAYLVDLGDIEKMSEKGVQANGREYPLALYILPRE